MCRKRWARLGAAVLRQSGGIEHDGVGRMLELDRQELPGAPWYCGRAAADGDAHDVVRNKGELRTGAAGRALVPRPSGEPAVSRTMVKMSPAWLSHTYCSLSGCCGRAA